MSNDRKQRGVVKENGKNDEEQGVAIKKTLSNFA